MTEQTLSCAVVRDLLPLYAEELTSEDSHALVQAHLQNCEACQAQLTAMQAEPEASPCAEQSLRKLKDRMRWKKLLVALTSIGVVVAVFAGTLGLSVVIRVPLEVTPADISTASFHMPGSIVHYHFQTVLQSRVPIPNADEWVIHNVITGWAYNEQGARETQQVIFLTSYELLLHNFTNRLFPVGDGFIFHGALLENSVYRIDPEYAADLSGCCANVNCFQDCIDTIQDLPPLIPTEHLQTTHVYFVPYRRWRAFLALEDPLTAEAEGLARLLWARE
ncbi:MAG: zf-HC2 domain-containing protein [Oscillospiraceae bacterium]|nr:zf-HC2 domain-containing protein [Oscillospiraceae bacterium]